MQIPGTLGFYLNSILLVTTIFCRVNDPVYLTSCGRTRHDLRFGDSISHVEEIRWSENSVASLRGVISGSARLSHPSSAEVWRCHARRDWPTTRFSAESSRLHSRDSARPGRDAAFGASSGATRARPGSPHQPRPDPS